MRVKSGRVRVKRVALQLYRESSVLESCPGRNSVQEIVIASSGGTIEPRN